MFEDIWHLLMKWFAERRQLEQHTTGLVIAKVAHQIQERMTFQARRYRYLRRQMQFMKSYQLKHYKKRLLT